MATASGQPARRVALLATLGLASVSGCLVIESFPPLAEPEDAGTTVVAAADAGPPLDASLADVRVDLCRGCDGTCVLGTCIVPRPRMPDSKDEAPSNGSTFDVCPQPGQPLYGQDCDYRANVPSFVTSDDIAADTITGLVWERVPMPGKVTADDVKTHCQTRSKEGFAGYADWRVPSAREALTLANGGKVLAGLDQAVFPSIPTSGMLTSTTPVNNGARVFVLVGNYPVMNVYDRTFAFPGSRCVRGGPLPEAPLEVGPGGASVTDPRTGLVWQRTASADTFTWAEALATCEALVHDGASDWRLPSYKELWSIISFDYVSPAVDPLAFPQTAPDLFWSSTPNRNFATQAYVVSFKDGSIPLGISPVMTEKHRVRCVRGGT